MRSLFLALLFLTTMVQAKEPDHITVPTEIHCFKIDILLSNLRNQYGEEPMFMGRSELDKDSATMIFINQQTGSYTVAAVGKYIGCILDVGNNVRYRLPKMLENKSM